MSSTIRRTTTSHVNKKAPSVDNLSNRSTISGSSRQTLMRSLSFSSLASTTFRTLQDDGDGTTSLGKAREEYESQYSLYLVRALQSKILLEDEKRELKTRTCLVSLKRDLEALLAENVRLNEEVRRTECYLQNIVELDDRIKSGRDVLRILEKNEFDLSLNALAESLECEANKLKLIGFKKKDLDEAFEKKGLGFDSPLYSILLQIQEYVMGHKSLEPELAQEIQEIQMLFEENEELKKRCMSIADEARSRMIASNYQKYFEMAKEVCKDLIPGISKPNSNSELLVNGTMHESADFGKPSSSSTPASFL